LNSSVLEVLILVVLIIANGILAMSEIAVVSARKVRLQQLADKGNKRAKTALELADEPTQFLSTVQIGISLVGILAGAYGGTTIARKLAAYLETVPVLAPYSETIGVGVVVAIITYFSLVIGELVPKRLALAHTERIAALVAGPMRFLSRLMAPLVYLVSSSTNLVIRLLGVSKSEEPEVTEDEVKILIEQGTQEGIFEESEQDMIEGVLRMGERSISMLMTPRTQINWLDLAASSEEIEQEIETHRHSVFPVAENSLNNLLGTVSAKDLVPQLLNKHTYDLKALLQPPLFIPETMLALRALDKLKQKGAKVAFVVNEYGSIEGMVTPDDFMEDIVGDLEPVTGPASASAFRRPDGSWLMDGLLHIDELKEVLEIKALPDENQDYYQTLGGFIIHRMNRIPPAGDWLDWNGYRFEVVDMDGPRVDKVLVRLVEAIETKT
jgi:putative hemolysin